jgi:hypothetical protein
VTDQLVSFEADEIVRDWRENGAGRDRIVAPFEEMAQAVLARATLHIHGESHAAAVAHELRRRAYASAFERAATFMASRLR